ncbi:MAG: hypothetical protein J6K61_02800 [Clostridia bacterium]|nr:hypothetical protein [Clostridia bacterium]
MAFGRRKKQVHTTASHLKNAAFATFAAITAIATVSANLIFNFHSALCIMHSAFCIEPLGRA